MLEANRKGLRRVAATAPAGYEERERRTAPFEAGILQGRELVEAGDGEDDERSDPGHRRGPWERSETVVQQPIHEQQQRSAEHPRGKISGNQQGDEPGSI